MSEPFVGQIQNFPYNFAPKGWAFCDGQLIPISQNTALFSLLGTFYGGDGKTTFALPNLQGRMLIGQGSGPGLTQRIIGETGGEATHTLLLSEMPQHSHGMQASDVAGRIASPTAGQPRVLGVTTRGAQGIYATSATGGVTMAISSVNIVGGNVAHDNMMQYLVTNYCIALQGIFPARN